MIKELNESLIYETKFVHQAIELFERIEDERNSPEFLIESLINLRSDVRRFLVNHLSIPLRLATTLAQIVVMSDELDKELAKSTKYKDPSLKKMVEKIMQISSELSSKDDSSASKLTDSIPLLLDKLEGNSERIELIKKTFDKIIHRLTSSDTTLRLKCMKLAAAIIQSNNNAKSRREVIHNI